MQVAILLHKTVVHDGRVLREAGALADAGHDVVIVHLPSGEDEEVAGGFRLRSATPPRWTRRLPPSLWRIVALGSIALGARAERPDVVHANDIATLIPGYFAARLTGAKLVYDTHEYAIGVPYRKAVWAWLAATIERLLIGRCDAVITVSDGIAERLQARYGLKERPTVVRNVPDLPPPGEAPDLREEMGIGDAPLVLHQGAVADGRGGENLIRAVAFTDSAHLLFLGADGAYADGLRRLALELDVGGRTHFYPPVALSELLSYTTQADVGVSLLQDSCDNHRLALPNKLFEYLAAGLPVVVSNLPEMRRLVIERQVGWVTDPGDPADIARVLLDATGARGDESLENRVRVAAAELNWSLERARLTDLYASLES
ncbi:MAG TPA: glycosyltransferase family 4 protein [Solirubrobacterales bacterium]|nr:glycosyltransferase family 4 protein [Solirubrobacterales bacterium]